MTIVGKSLDKIAELRENNKLPKLGRKKRQRAAKVKNVKLPVEVCATHKFILNYRYVNAYFGSSNFPSPSLDAQSHHTCMPANFFLSQIREIYFPGFFLLPEMTR